MPSAMKQMPRSRVAACLAALGLAALGVTSAQAETYKCQTYVDTLTPYCYTDRPSVPDAKPGVLIATNFIINFSSNVSPPRYAGGIVSGEGTAQLKLWNKEHTQLYNKKVQGGTTHLRVRVGTVSGNQSKFYAETRANWKAEEGAVNWVAACISHAVIKSC